MWGHLSSANHKKLAAEYDNKQIICIEAEAECCELEERVSCKVLDLEPMLGMQARPAMSIQRGSQVGRTQSAAEEEMRDQLITGDHAQGIF
jgi:hypothetical protein